MLSEGRRRLTVVLAITSVVLVVEVVGAIISGSLALLADAGHMLTDVAGLTLALVAAVLGQRPATDSRTWGYR
ncbi:MAG: cation transporter, partial [Actinomycetota bacterium]|nr:cation transporter [Actinomycetota bacterium]